MSVSRSQGTFYGALFGASVYAGITLGSEYFANAAWINPAIVNAINFYFQAILGSLTPVQALLVGAALTSAACALLAYMFMPNTPTAPASIPVFEKEVVNSPMHP